MEYEVPEPVDIKEATLKQLIELIGSTIVLDRQTTEEAMNRLNMLAETEPLFGVEAINAETLRSYLKYSLRDIHKIDRAELKEMVNFTDLLLAAQAEYQDKPTIEERIEAVGKLETRSQEKAILHYGGKALLGAKMENRGWILDPLIKEKSSVMLYADAGIGKTWLSWELIVTVAGGGQFASNQGLNWTAPKPRRVLVIDGEMNLSELRERFADTLNRHPIKVQKNAIENITIIPRQAQYWGTNFYDLNDKAYQDDLLAALATVEAAGNPYDLVILDNFSCLADVEDENSSSAFNGICQFLNRAKTMTTVLLVHHTKKNSGSKKNNEGMTYRGSSKLGGIMEVCIALSKPEIGDKPDHRGAAFAVHIEKFRGLRDARTEPKIFSLNPEEKTWNIKESEAHEQNEYFEAINSGEYTSYAAIGKMLNRDRSTVKRNIEKLVKQGALTTKDVERLLAKSVELPDDGEGNDDY
jgi:RecA-family ATPase